MVSFRSDYPLPGFAVGLAVLLFCDIASSGEIDYNRDIRPILSNKCFQCHGPDEETLEADLRLDLPSDHSVEGSVIVPGAPEASELIFRLTTNDSSDVMPPPKTKKPITKEETALLKQWVKEGAKYQSHWSFEPIDLEVTPPVLADSQWQKNGVDRFILESLQDKNITPSSEAQPETLARRIAIDLTGLLPSPEEVDVFIKAYQTDPDPAVKEFIESQLASPHYGERWGRHWLDQARYADSSGYTIDGERTMWPYRDWVIKALNEDRPFDQFTIEQLAGDLLESPKKEQLIASAFHRNTLINQEGGTDDEQFRNEEVVDRVNTTGAVWLGLTVGCAQCHTHKFDPITHKEYFEFFAFFNQGTDVNNTGSTIPVAEGELFSEEVDPALLAAHAKAKGHFDKINAQTKTRREEWEKLTLTSLKENPRSGSASWLPQKPYDFEAEGGAPLKLLEDDSLLAGIGAPKEVYHLALPGQSQPTAAIRLRILPDPSLPKNGPGLAGNGNIVLNRVEFYQNDKRIAISSADHDHAQPGFSAAFLIDDNPATGWAINVGKGSAPGAKMNTPHEVHFILSKPVAVGVPIKVVMRHEQNANYNVGRFAFDTSSTAPPSPDTAKFLAALETAVEKRDANAKTLLDQRFAGEDTDLLDAKSKLASVAKAAGLGKEVKLMVMKDLANSPRETHIHIRGDFLRKDKKTGTLFPDVPAVFPELPLLKTGQSRNRLDLAKWLVSPENPLTARVTVNRLWMRYFGKGIVETENDFGTQGSFPSHPELLDWLATQFVEGGWSMKNLHRLILNSATYRQASHARPDLVELDPLNHLLAKQNRIRFDAEIVRDAALSASGLLEPKLGGPSVMPPQPEGIYSFTQRKTSWVVPNNENRFRRALYVKFIRSAPYPLFTTFDSPDFQSVCTSRARSNTPLQSLTLANDAALFELAQGLAERLLEGIPSEGDSSDLERIKLGFKLCYSREPTEKEQQLLTTFRSNQEASFASNEEAAQSVAPKRIPKDLSPATAASWTSLARTLMNTDEFITRE
ncbi:PSD1 and planctomycete cytochrome C domain-containing protein [Verrucomicrobiales bacterium]|nr:PSD1 and planctomycete cytochrome C domain-containing protein [Verrucomicrobiales bacterium]